MLQLTEARRVWVRADGDGGHEKTRREHIELEATVGALVEALSKRLSRKYS